MTTDHYITGGRVRAARGRALRLVTATAAAAALAACNLDVETPSIVAPTQLRDSTARPTLVAGALGDFGVAYAGNDELGEEGIILVGGLRADEWLNRDTFEERRDIDLGTMRTDNGSLRDLFRSVQRARRSAEFAGSLFAELAPDDPGYSQVLSLGAFSYVLLGENFCSGVPISNLSENGQLEFGAPLTTEQMFTTALLKLDSALAIAVAAKDDDLANLARVGRGRVLLDLARFADAATAVAAVPLDFSFDIEYSENSPRQNNAVFTFNNVRRRWGVADNEGGNGLPFVSAADPRVPTQRTARNGLDGENVRIVNQLKFPTRGSSIPLADGIEARLIAAEAALQAGNTAAAFTTLNALRATSTGAAAVPLVPAATAAGRTDQLFRERAFWLFATAHRLGDLRRLLRPPYSRPFTQVYPQGTYFKSAVPYGAQASLIIPLEEENNPQFAGCQGTT
jgi:hypothetical protein